MYERILVPVDGSNHPLNALQAAIELSKGLGSVSYKVIQHAACPVLIVK